MPMKTVAQIKLPIQKEMELFEKKFSNSMISKVSLSIDNVMSNFIEQGNLRNHGIRKFLFKEFHLFFDR